MAVMCDTPASMAGPMPGAQSAGTLAPRPRVLYVMGAGRSGSTVLGVTLGNCEGVFYAGELDAWLPRDGEPQIDDEQRTRFWADVRARVEGASELSGIEVQRSLERSMAVLRPQLWPTRRRLRGRYRRVSESLYRAVAQATGGMLIVDTSHYPLRALELQAIEGIDLYLLYLVRDPQSVVASFNRTDVAQYRKSTLYTNVYLWVTNLLSTLVFLKHPRPRRLFVTHEEFVDDPERILRYVLGRTGVRAEIPDLGALSTGVAFQGNRLIRSEVIGLSPEASTPVGRSLLTAVAQLPWRLVFGAVRAGATPAGAGEQAETPLAASGSER